MLNNLRLENSGLDTVDKAILVQLTGNARTTIAELARKVKLSAPSVAERIKRLEDAGIITGYHAAVSPKVLGLPLSVWFRIRPVPGKMQQVAGIIQGIPEITACDRITGEDCFLARGHFKSVEHLERVIDLLVPYAMTNTSIIQSSPVKERLPLISDSSGL